MFKSNETVTEQARPRGNSTISLMDTTLSSNQPQSPAEPRPASAPIAIPISRTSPSIHSASISSCSKSSPSTNFEPGRPPLSDSTAPKSTKTYPVKSTTPPPPPIKITSGFNPKPSQSAAVRGEGSQLKKPSLFGGILSLFFPKQADPMTDVAETLEEEETTNEVSP